MPAHDARAMGFGAARPARPTAPPPSRWDLPTGPPANGTDIVAIGADLEPGTLLAAYSMGLFPMPFKRRKIAWFSPDPRGILPLDGLKISRSLRRSMRRYEVTFNRSFREVMVKCADPTREGAWLNRTFVDAYCRLHELGWAHSVEVYQPESGVLVGGLYGVRIDDFFAGEAMFHTATDASKVALVHLVNLLNDQGVSLLDIQWNTPHLSSLGAISIPRSEYLERLAQAVPTSGEHAIADDHDGRSTILTPPESRSLND